MMKALLLALAILFWLPKATAEQLEIHGFEFPPYIMQTHTGVTNGIAVELINRAAQRADLKVVYRLSNWARAFRTVSEHRGDGLIPTMRTPDREQFFYYPDTALLELNQRLIVRQDKELPAYQGDFTQLAQYRVGKVREARISPSFDAALERGDFTAEPFNSVHNLVRSLLTNRVDTIATDKRQALFMAKRIGQGGELKCLSPGLGSVPVFLAFSQKRVKPHVVARFNQALAQVLAEGALQELELKYLGTSTQS